MVFSSTMFLFAFLPVTLAGYYLIRRELRNVFLLIMSLLFYAVGEPYFAFIMIVSIEANYLLGLLIWRAKKAAAGIRHGLLILTLAINLGLLFYYKYYDFAVSNLNHLFGTDFALRYIALPIGVSFFTFQGMSYVLDVYMGKSDVQKNPLNVALYVALFPQLIAGPIVRYSDIDQEITERKEGLELSEKGLPLLRRQEVGRIIGWPNRSIVYQLKSIHKLKAALVLCYSVPLGAAERNRLP